MILGSEMGRIFTAMTCQDTQVLDCTIVFIVEECR